MFVCFSRTIIRIGLIVSHYYLYFKMLLVQNSLNELQKGLCSCYFPLNPFKSFPYFLKIKRHLHGCVFAFRPEYTVKINYFSLSSYIIQCGN